jgi:hypothetical protein
MKLFRSLDELEISGSVSELAEIHKSLINATENYSETLFFDTSGSPKPYDFQEKKLTISISPDPACALFNEELGVVITGNVASIRVLASFFDFELDAKTGEHYHWDNLCDSEYTSENTLTIVVSVV